MRKHDGLVQKTVLVFLLLFAACEGAFAGTFGPPVVYATGAGPSSVAVGDFNGDNNLDLAVANQLANTVSVLLGNGDGTFQQAVNYPVGTSPAGVVTTCNTLSGGTLDLAVEQLRERSRR